MTTLQGAPPTSGYLYLRQSLDRSGDELAVTRQEEDGRELAERRGITDLTVLADNDLSAAGRRKRPGFEELITAISDGSAPVVIAWDLTRLTRNRRDTVRLIEACQLRGVTIMLVRGSDIDMATPAGRLIADILGGVARHEIEVKGERQRRAIVQAAVAGERVGGRRPFGYEADGTTLRPGEAAAAAEGFQMLLTGASLAEIARRWNAAGFTAQKAWKHGGMSPWRPDSVRTVLRNPRYAGIRRYRSEINGELLSPAQWPGVVPEETWREADAILSDPARRHTPRGGPRLLSGLALCGVCGATVHAGAAVRHYPMYRCSASYGHFCRKAEPVEAYVAAYVVARCSRPEIRRMVTATRRPDTARLRLERSTLDSRLETIAVQFADGELTAGQLRAMTARIRGRLAEIDTAMADAGKVSVLGPMISAADKQETWDGLTRSQQRAIIGMLATIRIDPPGRGVREFRPSTVRIDQKGRE